VRCLLLLLLAGVARADLVADLVADAESVAPGGTIHVGVRFSLEPHFHVYWKYEGDSGQAPTVRWKLPAGVTASDLAWPAPVRIPTPPFMTFGYEGEVTLSSEITVPKDYAQAVLPVAADVDWLVCDENGCTPGDASLGLEIPVRPGDAPRTPIASGLPVPAGEVTARYRGSKIVLLAVSPGAPLFFFPGGPGMVEPSENQHPVEQAGTKGLLLTPAKSAEGPVKELRGVLAFEEGPAWEVEVPVEPEGAAAPGRLKWAAIMAALVLAYAAHRMLRSRKETPA
jgi:hypothetical protein